MNTRPTPPTIPSAARLAAASAPPANPTPSAQRLEVTAPTMRQLAEDDLLETHAEIMASVNAAAALEGCACNLAWVTRQEYVSSMIAALAAWTRSPDHCDDDTGAALLEKFAREYARHEATVV